MKKKSFTLKCKMILCMAVATSVLTPITAHANSDPELEDLKIRLEKLEADNKKLMKMLQQRIAADEQEKQNTQVASKTSSSRQSQTSHRPRGENTQSFVGVSSDYSFRILDHAETVTTKQIELLKARQNGEINSVVTLGGAITVLANIQNSTSDSKFGWLMRHPTSNNQIGKHVSEIVIHSAQLATTMALTDSLTAYAEMLYDPEQSFGAGTITALTRNQIQLRRAYVIWGNLNKSPLYLAAGKMSVPFGLNDTVSPFTNSTNWHAFAGLAYGGQVGYSGSGINVRAMAVQGGSQFRGANAPVRGTSVPSKVNNFAVDASYTYDGGQNFKAQLGASYLHASAYCQGYPVQHFNPCADTVPAYAVYGTLNVGRLKLLGDFAATTKVWPGTAVPDPTNPLSRFAPAKVFSITAGGRYSLAITNQKNIDVSFEFSRFQSGAKGSPWRRQNQWVIGVSHYIRPNINLFGEAIRTDGYVPLNFISGGNFPDGSSWSELDSHTNVLNIGVQAAF